ncbi:MAG: hypothetical protein H5U06_01965 [Candidatus Aminicenantes bacterium]|nr:hypothetical protein [Candidatus Aminicenantes bacterium]
MRKVSINQFQLLLIMAIIFGFLLSVPEALSPEKKPLRPLRAGEESRGSWWMKQTAISSDGQMASLKSKRWWKKASELKPGESLVVEEKGEAKDRMVIKVESYEREDGEEVQVLVWVIDDDGDESLKSGGDFHDDCYVYDLNRDGLVDVLVDYADENDDGQADYMEIRLFERGQLVRAWFGYDFENIGEIFKFRNPLDLISEKFSQNLSGNKFYFKNVLNPLSGTWAPADICPVASFDLNQDGLSDLVVRFNLQPTSSFTKATTSFEPINFWSKELQSVVIHSLEISYDVDRGNSLENPFHYDLGLILEGCQAYDFSNFKTYSPKRRPPQEVYVIPYEKTREILNGYQADTAGFSWKEFSDLSIADNSNQGETEGQGIGWVWERRPLTTSSLYIQKWNIRREVAEGLIAPPEFYYSDLDQRIHLYGATEGWIQVGNFAGLPRLGEIRYFDTDGNGFFDRREIYLTNSSRPVLVMAAKEEKAKKIPFDLKQVSEFYLNDILPEALARNEKLLQAMKDVYVFELPAGLKEAMDKASFSERRYLLDIYCLLYFINLRDHFLTLANQRLFQETIKDTSGKFYGDLYPGLFKNPREVASALKSDQAWKLVRLLTDIELAFSQAEVEKTISLLKRIKDLKL